jgi:hypothetical protein
MKTILKTTVFSFFLLAAFVLPRPAHALLLDELFEDAPNGPHCLFMDCHDQQPTQIDNSINNSFNNNTNSFNGSTYLPPAVPSYSPAPSSNNNYNYNYNYSSGANTSTVPPPYYYPYPIYQTSPVRHQPVYYSQPTYQYPPAPLPTYYSQPNYYYTQPTYYAPITVAPAIQVACAADVTSARTGIPVTWSAEALYNNSSYGLSYSWSGTDGLYGNNANAIKVYYSTGVKSAIVTVTAANGQTASKACSNTVTIKNTSSGTVAKATPKATPTVTPTPEPEKISAASLFSLNNVPWGWVAVLVILVLLGLVLYMIFNKKKI